MKLYSRKTQCPICKSKVIKNDDVVTITEYYCTNGCYKETVYSNFHKYWIDYDVFDKNFQIASDLNQLERQKIIESLKTTIRYWRKDNRYLVELMGVE